MDVVWAQLTAKPTASTDQPDGDEQMNDLHKEQPDDDERMNGLHKENPDRVETGEGNNRIPFVQETTLEQRRPPPFQPPHFDRGVPTFSTPSQKRNANKRRNNGIDLNKRPSQRTRKKKYWPKVVSEGKPRRTPKPKTPEPATPKRASSEKNLSGKRKYVRKGSLRNLVTPSDATVTNREDEVGEKVVCEGQPKMTPKLTTPRPSTPNHASDKNKSGKRKYVRKGTNKDLVTPSDNVAGENNYSVVKTCKRALSFDLENHSQDDCSMARDTSQCQLQSSCTSIPVNQCCSISRELGPNFQQIWKKKRISRRRRTNMSSIIWSLKHTNKNSTPKFTPKELHDEVHNSKIYCHAPPTKKRSNTYTRRRNIAELIALLPVQKVCKSKVEIKKKRTKGYTRRRSNLTGLTAPPVCNHNHLPSTEMKEQVLEIFHGAETCNDALLFGDNHERIVTRMWAKDTSEFYNSKSEGSLPSDALFGDNRERSVKWTETRPLVGDSKCTQMEPSFVNLDFQDNGTHGSPQKHEDFWPSAKSRGTQKERINFRVEKFTCLSNEQNNLLERDRNAYVPNSGHRTPVPFEEQEQIAHGRHGTAPTKSKGLLEGRIDVLVRKLMCMCISDGQNQLLVQDRKAGGLNSRAGTLVPYQEQDHNAHDPTNNHATLVPYQGPLDPLKKRRALPKVNLDPETLKVWKQLMDKKLGKDETKADEKKEKWWAEERNVFRGRINAFLGVMNDIQGDRRFTQWKGSVVDSVVGVFLTQNVSDHLSSSAYMSLAAKFPSSNYRSRYENLQITDNQESAESNIEPAGATDNSECNEFLVFETEPDELENGAETLATTAEGTSLEETPDTRAVKDAVDETKIATRITRIKKFEKEEEIDWDALRRLYSPVEPRSSDHMDSVDWEAVRCAEEREIATAIKDRGQQNIIAGRIKDFLNRVVTLHKSIDLEWLRNIPPDLAKEYLLKINGLGLKSVECVRLLSLQNIAFPVDTNVGRIAVRLGWVPLQPLPENLQIHLLEQYPLMDTIQKYLWPRLCTLDQRTLYELHYQMITFGKVFCTKKNPKCSACPMKGDCRHFASAFASARLALPTPAEKSIISSMVPSMTIANLNLVTNPTSLFLLEPNPFPESGYQTKNYDPIIEEPTSPEPDSTPIIEVLASPERECLEPQEMMIEDFFKDNSDPNEIHTIKLGLDRFTTYFQNVDDNHHVKLHQNNMSGALVALTAESASIPVPKLKNASRLRTEHRVYVLPDCHCLLTGLDKREDDDPCPYLLAIWKPGEMADSFESPTIRCNSKSGKLCYEKACIYCNSIREQNPNTTCGTVLIPSRTAMKGRFPLNGTYFQVNEVFADDETSKNPIHVPREWIWHLERRTAYFASSATTIFRGLSADAIRSCFKEGFICVRGFDRKTGAPRPLAKRLHISANKMGKARTDDE